MKFFSDVVMAPLNELEGIDKLISLVVLYLLSFFYSGIFNDRKSNLLKYINANQTTTRNTVMLLCYFLIVADILYYTCAFINYKRASHIPNLAPEAPKIIVDNVFKDYINPIFKLNFLFGALIITSLLVSNLIRLNVLTLFNSLNTGSIIAIILMLFSVACHTFLPIKNFFWRTLNKVNSRS